MGWDWIEGDVDVAELTERSSFGPAHSGGVNPSMERSTMKAIGVS